MTKSVIERIAREVDAGVRQVEAALRLLSNGATVPFIARYRKEQTDGLDEVIVTAIRDANERIENTEKRRAAVLESLRERNLLAPELERKLSDARTLAEIEDLYLPYRPKKRTRATIAREKGLEPLARAIFDQKGRSPKVLAAGFLLGGSGAGRAADGGPEIGATGPGEAVSPEEALAGAADIIAEIVAEDTATRTRLRSLFADHAVLSSTVVRGKETEGATFRDYFEWGEPARKAAAHRIHAILRGRELGVLVCHAVPEESRAIDVVRRIHVKGSGADSELVAACCEDGYRRLLRPSMENELFGELKLRADREAIRVFAANVREVLMAAPFGARRVLAIDPGFRTGCKVVCLDEQGSLLFHTTIFPLEPAKRTAEAAAALRTLVADYRPDAFAVGNGTGGREAADFCRSLGLKAPDGTDVPVIPVSESGASIYSASEVAREEYPDHDLTVRGAISIGRRLCDPLAELVKIDPRSIGVGQYQHDVDQKMLRTALDDVVSSCVNAVGVELNTASPQLLRSVSGLSERIAGRIVRLRSERGGLKSRLELLDVDGLGPKIFEQSAGFLRIRDGTNPLDASAVHPERYALVERIAGDLGCSTKDLMSDRSIRSRVKLDRYVSDGVGMPTLEDIMDELERPGRDPRATYTPFSFASGVREMVDLKQGMKLPGIVTNVTAFGAFVDVGVHQDGLVHISRLADRFVRDPSEVVRAGQQVTVTVIGVDLDRRRISLSMRGGDGAVPEGE